MTFPMQMQPLTKTTPHEINKALLAELMTFIIKLKNGRATFDASLPVVAASILVSTSCLSSFLNASFGPNINAPSKYSAAIIIPIA